MSDGPEVVLDASALLAALHGEPGGAGVEARLQGAVLSSVNYAEVVQQSLARGVDLDGFRADLEALGIMILPFTIQDAERAAGMWPVTSKLGLSLGDRACLALALRLGLPVMTADRIWGKVTLGVDVQLIR
jgi:PIN domain nuclease of toxin-antitoxin system